MEAEKKIPNKKHDGKRNSGEEEVIMCLTLTHFRTFPFYQALFTETLSDSSENLWQGVITWMALAIVSSSHLFAAWTMGCIMLGLMSV